MPIPTGIYPPRADAVAQLHRKRNEVITVAASFRALCRAFEFVELLSLDIRAEHTKYEWNDSDGSEVGADNKESIAARFADFSWIWDLQNDTSTTLKHRNTKSEDY